MRFILFSFFFLPLTLLCQEVDSLKHYSHSENPEEQISALIKLSDLYFYSNPDSTYEFLKEALYLSEKYKMHKINANILIKLGVFLNEKGEIKDARNYFISALSVAKELKDTSLILSATGNMGNCSLNLGEYDKAVKYYSDVIKISEKSGNKRITAIAYGALGNLYLIKNDYDKALKYYKISEKSFKSINDKNGIALSLLNIATVYTNKEKYSQAINKYLKAEKIFQELNNTLNSAKCLSGIAKIYRKKGNYKHSNIFEKKALESYKKFDSKSDIVYAYDMIAHNYIDLKKYNTAIIFLDSSLSILNNNTEKNYSTLEQVTENLRICYDSLHNYKEAYRFSLLNKTYYDSIFNAENSEKFSELEIKFETERKEQQIELFKKDKKILEKESRTRLILLLSISGLLLFSAIIFLLIYNRFKLKTQIQKTHLENKLLRVQMNPHFIFNALSSIEYFIYKNDFESSSLYISNLSKLLRLILESSRKDNITLSEEIKIIKYYAEFQKLQSDKNVSFIINISENIDTENCLIPPMLIQPFIENSFKHGFNQEINNAEIIILFKLINNFIFVEIRDNGIGIEKSEKNKDKLKSSLAIQITKERLINIYGKKLKSDNILSITDLSKISPEKHGTLIKFKLPYVEEF